MYRSYKAKLIATPPEVRLAEESMVAFRPKPSWEVIYAETLYNGWVVHKDSDDITEMTLQISTNGHHAFQNKMLLQRETICFVALMLSPHFGTQFQPVAIAFGDLLVAKHSTRGMAINRSQLAYAATADVAEMVTHPFPWAERWLSEFRDVEDGNMVAILADHCLRLHQTYQREIEQARPK